MPQEAKDRLRALETIPEAQNEGASSAPGANPSASAAKASGSAEGGMKPTQPVETDDSSMAPAVAARMEGPVTEDRGKATHEAKEYFQRRKETHLVTPAATNPKSENVVGHPVYGSDAVRSASCSSTNQDSEYHVMWDYLASQMDAMNLAHGDMDI